MSLCSAKGRSGANRLKKENSHPYQHWLFQMIGKEFKNEPYRVYHNSAIKKSIPLIGIEKRAGDTWPNKQWGGFEELSYLIQKDGFDVREFHQRGMLRLIGAHLLGNRILQGFRLFRKVLVSPSSYHLSFHRS